MRVRIELSFWTPGLKRCGETPVQKLRSSECFWLPRNLGVLLSLFGGGAELGVFAAVVIGAGFGMMFGVISYAFTGGRRDFTSTSQIVASEYEVLCMPGQSAPPGAVKRLWELDLLAAVK